jgi:hypothetical protein
MTVHHLLEVRRENQNRGVIPSHGVWENALDEHTRIEKELWEEHLALQRQLESEMADAQQRAEKDQLIEKELWEEHLALERQLEREMADAQQRAEKDQLNSSYPKSTQGREEERTMHRRTVKTFAESRQADLELEDQLARAKVGLRHAERGDSRQADVDWEDQLARAKAGLRQAERGDSRQVGVDVEEQLARAKAGLRPTAKQKAAAEAKANAEAEANRSAYRDTTGHVVQPSNTTGQGGPPAQSFSADLFSSSQPSVTPSLQVDAQRSDEDTVDI